MRDNRYFFLAIFSTFLAFFVIILGAYTRLTDAGLGCPDWPGCYGHWIVQTATLNPDKAWTEMIHRYFAGALGILIALLAIFGKSQRLQSKVPFFLLLLVIFQALLGMWTVTLKLFPLVVVAHLLGGMAIFALLGYLVWDLGGYGLGGHRGPPLQISVDQKTNRTLKIFSTTSVILLSLQLFLGGWTSANYAALVCLDFPFCQAIQWNSTNLAQAFNLSTAGPANPMGQTLSASALMTIHMVHRIGALLTAVSIVLLSFFIFKRSQNSVLRRLVLITLTLLTLQIALGITNVLAILPLFIAVAHTGVAALLLLSMVILKSACGKNPSERLLVPHESTARLSYTV